MTTLTARWTDVRSDDWSETERVTLLEGEEAASCDCGAAGGIDILTPTKREYINYVVEPAYSSDLAADDDLAYWQSSDSDDDPRLRWFALGWERYIRDNFDDEQIAAAEAAVERERLAR